jgi:PIN domain nuclease of toxin-antitoxin system
VKLLLDTHVLLWWVAGDRRLSKAIKAVVSSTGNDVAVSAATFWEVAIKSALGRIDVDLEELRVAALDDGFLELPVQIDHTLQLAGLPEHHRDPFDRLLVAQSIAENRRLVTTDQAILRYRGTAGFNPLWQ